MARLPSTARTSRPWRIHEITGDSRLEDDGWAAEIANRTMHGVMHLGWVPDGAGGYRGQMAVLVKPNGLLGTVYMGAIRPFRHLIVYPPMIREIGRIWRAGADDPTPAPA
jgi:hypothetical protein